MLVSPQPAPTSITRRSTKWSSGNTCLQSMYRLRARSRIPFSLWRAERLTPEEGRQTGMERRAKRIVDRSSTHTLKAQKAHEIQRKGTMSAASVVVVVISPEQGLRGHRRLEYTRPCATTFGATTLVSPRNRLARVPTKGRLHPRDAHEIQHRARGTNNSPPQTVFPPRHMCRRLCHSTQRHPRRCTRAATRNIARLATVWDSLLCLAVHALQETPMEGRTCVDAAMPVRFVRWVYSSYGCRITAKPWSMFTRRAGASRQ